MTSAEERARELWHKLSARNAIHPEQELAAFIHKTERDKANETWEAAAEIADNEHKNYVGETAPMRVQSVGRDLALQFRSRIIKGKP